MYPLNTIHALNNTPPAIKDNFNRDSSFVKSRGGYVIHSGIHRSTAFVSPGEAFDALTFWKDYGQPAINGFIEALVNDNYDLDKAEETATRRTWPDHQFIDQNSSGHRVITATTEDFRISGISWRDVHSRLHVLKQRANPNDLYPDFLCI